MISEQRLDCLKEKKSYILMQCQRVDDLVDQHNREVMAMLKDADKGQHEQIIELILTKPVRKD